MKKSLASALIALSGLGVVAAPAGAVTHIDTEPGYREPATVSAGPCTLRALPVTGDSNRVHAKVTISCREDARVEPAVELWEEDLGDDDRVRGTFWSFGNGRIAAGQTRTFTLSGSCKSTELGNEEFFTRARFTVSFRNRLGNFDAVTSGLVAASAPRSFDC